MNSKFVTPLILLLSLSSCGTPAYAKVMDTKYDGSCHAVTQKYQHQNPDPGDWDAMVQGSNVKKQTGYIPPEFLPDNSDILSCIPEVPPTVMGPK